MTELEKWEWLGHWKLHRLIRVEGVIEAVEPLHIGVGRAPSPGSPSDNPIVRIRIGPHEIPYIPGSSLKGVFRSTTESLLRSLGLKSCSPFLGLCIGPIRDRVCQLSRDGQIEEAQKLLDDNLCIACKIFGSASYRSLVVMGDAFAIEGTYAVGMRTCVAIDRRRGAAARGRLFNIEYVQPGSLFSFSLCGKNLPNYAIGLLAVIIDYINQGWVKIGGCTSRGFGRVRIRGKEGDYPSFSIIERPFTSEEKKLPEADKSVNKLTKDDVPIEDLTDFEKIKRAWWEWVR